jgi:DNA-binding MarR family transcriptional regulator
MLDELEPLGAVRRTPDPSDRRRRILTLTAAGRRLHATAVAAAAAADDELLAGFAAADRAALIHQLRAVGAAHGFDYS